MWQFIFNSMNEKLWIPTEREFFFHCYVNVCGMNDKQHINYLSFIHSISQLVSQVSSPPLCLCVSPWSQWEMCPHVVYLFVCLLVFVCRWDNTSVVLVNHCLFLSNINSLSIPVHLIFYNLIVGFMRVRERQKQMKWNRSNDTIHSGKNRFRN